MNRCKLVAAVLAVITARPLLFCEGHGLAQAIMVCPHVVAGREPFESDVVGGVACSTCDLCLNPKPPIAVCLECAADRGWVDIDPDPRFADGWIWISDETPWPTLPTRPAPPWDGMGYPAGATEAMIRGRRR